MKIHIHTGDWNEFFQNLCKRRRSELDPDGSRTVDHPEDADLILDLSSNQSLKYGYVFGVDPTSPYHRWPDRTLAWDASDDPTGRLPGFFCSLERSSFDPRCHETICYPLVYNREVRFRAHDEATCLFGFSGSPSSGLRARIFEHFGEDGDDARVRQSRSLWDTMFADGHNSEKTLYADELARCRFILCPRGNGVASIRIYEALQTGRVPVILSDRFVPPSFVNWERCAVFIRERDVARVRDVLRERDADWPALARSAHEQYEACLSDASQLRTMAAAAPRLLENSRRTRRSRHVAYTINILPTWAAARARRTAREILRRS